MVAYKVALIEISNPSQEIVIKNYMVCLTEERANKFIKDFNESTKPLKLFPITQCLDTVMAIELNEQEYSLLSELNCI